MKHMMVTKIVTTSTRTETELSTRVRVGVSDPRGRWEGDSVGVVDEGKGVVLRW